MRLFLVLLAAFAMTACATIPTAPAPVLSQTAIDEKAVVLAFETVDALATVIDSQVASGKIVAGSAKAKTIQSALISARKWLPIAADALRAGNAASYGEAATHATEAIRTITAALK